MEDSKALQERIARSEREVKQEINIEESESSGLEDVPPSNQVITRNIKQEDGSDEEELEQPAQVTVEEFKEDVPEGFYANIMPAVSSAQSSVSFSRPQTSLQLQWKGQEGAQLSSQISSGDQQHQWVDDKGVLTIAPNVGAQWIAADAQGFPERNATLVKDGNVQYVLMTSADSFYLVESGDGNAICASDGSIKNIVSGDKNIQMISLVPSENLTNSGMVIGGMPGEVPQEPNRGENVMVSAGSSNKRSSESQPTLSTIALEDCDIKHVEPTRKKKKNEKLSPVVPDTEGSCVKKGCDLTSCPLRCTAVFDEEEREEINKAFQSLSTEDQKKFIMQCCTRKIYVKDVKGFDGSSKTQSNFKYDFQLRSAKGVPVQVCKLFFASTLGFTEFFFNCFLTDIYKSSSSAYSRSSQCTCTGVTNSRHRGKSTAGRWAASCKIHSDVYSHVNKDLFHRHIESFLRTLCVPQGDQYRTIRYLPKDVSIQMMYEDFSVKHPEIVSSYELYKNFVVLFTS